jgi:hypothetical protein
MSHPVRRYPPGPGSGTVSVYETGPRLFLADYNGLVCTLSWFPTPDGYEVFFNRDERRSREPAVPPAIHTRDGIRFVAPLDSDFGGSWLAVNEHGVTLAVENGYTDLDDLAHEPAEGFTSRGLLLTSLADCRSSAEALRRVEGLDLHKYRSFLLTVFDEDGTGLLARWVRGLLSVDRKLEDLVPIISSSFETDDVRRSRRDLFHRLRDRAGSRTAELHLAYHASHLPQKSAYSTCMHRPEARTVSFSHVQVDQREARFHYVPHPPCQGRPAAPPITLARVRR